MSKKVFLWIIGIALLAIFVVGSLIITILFQLRDTQQSVSLVQTQDLVMVSTQAAQTVIAEFTKQAADATFTETSTLLPTLTETPTALPSLTSAAEIATSSITPIPPTMIVPTFTPVALVCNRAQLVRDVTIQDYSAFSPGTPLTKVWRLKNVGSCTWTKGYNLVFVSGNAMEARLIIPLQKSVEPDQTVDLSVPINAPKNPGTYRGDWMLSDSAGTRFGVGANGDQTFWMAIRVMATVNANLIYDFAGNNCQAVWTGGGGGLPCSGTSSATEGFVTLLDAPNLESGLENEWTLWTHPNNQSRGWISGTYPEFVIQPNHHFRAWVGCLADSKGCNVTFRLDFKNLKTGAIRNLGSWHEVYDGKLTKIDLDLSQHVGKQVQFILTVEQSGGNPALANAFWFVPGISDVPAPTAIPPTSTPTEAATPVDTPIPTDEISTPTP